MKTYLLQAPDRRGRILPGFTFQVCSRTSSGPDANEIEQTLRGMGYNDTETISWRAPGNWKIKEMPSW